MTQLVRFYHPAVGIRIGVLRDSKVHDVTDTLPSVTAFLRSTLHHVQEAIAGVEAVAADAEITYPITLFDNDLDSGLPCLLAPCDDQDVWAAGVTYERSRAARQEEAQDGGDVYARVYVAERPELFFKSQGRRVVGTRGPIGIRADSHWNVPEPELVLVINPAMELVGFSIGNDMSSRDIEGANPLYLPQAKVYKYACALGPGILLNPSSTWPDVHIDVRIQRDGAEVFNGTVHTSRIKRRIEELISFLGRSTEFPDGVMLFTGTGIVPPNDFTLAAGDQVSITVDFIGTLTNTVEVV
jgi:2-dehydro-3-deoxy-D-arabinonate dehydratase